MAEYIEREKVYDIFSIKQQALLKYHRYYQLNDADKEEFDLYDSYMNEVESIPSADVVEVVRCSECQQYTPVEGGKPLCALHNIACSGDDFCSYGERRTENES